MKFEIDKHTIEDLNIFPKNKKDVSIFDLFKDTQTVGGQNAVLRMMKYPVSDYEILKERLDAIEFISQKNLSFDFEDKLLDFIDHYLNQNIEPLRKGWIFALSDWITYSIKPTNEYFIEYTSQRVVNLIWGNAKISNKWWGVI